MKQNSGNALMKALPLIALLGGSGFGYAVALFGTYFLAGSISKLLAVLIGSAWVTLLAFATKIGDITEAPSLSPSEHRKLEDKCKKAVRRVWLWSVLNFFFVIVVLVPAAFVDAKAPVYDLMMILAGMAAGFSVYSIVLHAQWQEELREFRSSLRLRERERAESKHIAGLFQDTKSASSGEVASEIISLNRVSEWPSKGKARQ